MKKIVLLVVLFAMTAGMLLAQSNDTGMEKKIIIMRDGMEEKGEINVNMILRGKEDAAALASSGFFGFYTEDLSYPSAQKLGYPYLFGVLITGVVPNSPAWEYRLQEEDVIMYLNDREIKNQAEFDRIRKNLRAGDQVTLQIWRESEVLDVEMVLGTRTPSVAAAPDKPKKLSAGYGGGSWVPMWFNPDMKDVNDLLTGMGFAPLGENGLVMQGGAGKGPIGNGFFIGGQVVGYDENKKIPDPTDGTYHEWMRYNVSMGGVTLDKRIPFSKNFIGSLGVMLGGGGHEIEILRSNSSYTWPVAGASFNTGNSNALITRHFLVVQPRMELMYRLLPWMGIRAEGGYTYGYSPSEGWRVQGMNGETFEITNSPNTSFQGFNISIGPWFGF